MSKLRYLIVPTIMVGALMVLHDVSTSMWFEQMWCAYRYP